MGKHSTVIQITNAPQIARQLNEVKKSAEKALNMTVKDFKDRAPAWVSRAVREEYGIRVQDIEHNNGKIKRIKGMRQAGKVFAKGKTVNSAGIIYTGRVLTPTHFGMSPKTPNKRVTTLKAKIRLQNGKKTMGVAKMLTKKQRKEIGKNFHKKGSKRSKRSPVMLMHTGNKGANGIDYIPMRRVSNNRKDLHVIKTLSLPQMVENPLVTKAINAAVQENVNKRLKHCMERYMGK